MHSSRECTLQLDSTVVVRQHADAPSHTCPSVLSHLETAPAEQELAV